MTRGGVHNGSLRPDNGTRTRGHGLAERRGAYRPRRRRDGCRHLWGRADDGEDRRAEHADRGKGDQAIESLQGAWADDGGRVKAHT